MATRKLLTKKKPKEAKISGNEYVKENNQKYVKADMHVDNIKPLKKKKPELKKKEGVKRFV